MPHGEHRSCPGWPPVARPRCWGEGVLPGAEPPGHSLQPPRSGPLAEPGVAFSTASLMGQLPAIKAPASATASPAFPSGLIVLLYCFLMGSPLSFPIMWGSLSPSFSAAPLYFRDGIRKLLSFSSSPVFHGFHNSSYVTLPSALYCSGFIPSYSSEVLPSVLHISLLGWRLSNTVLLSFHFLLFSLSQRPPNSFENPPRNRLGSIATIISIKSN